MNKKIFVVFLICCMMFSIASPALAADELPSPDSSWVNYIIFSGSGVSSTSDSTVSSPFAVVFPFDSYLNNASLVDETFSSYNICYDSKNGSIRFLLDPSASSVMDHELYYRTYYYNGTTWIKLSTGGMSKLLDNAYYSGISGFKCSETDFYNISLDSDKTTFLCHYFPEDNQYIFSDTVFPVAPPDPMVNLAEQMIKKTPEALDLGGKMMILVPFGISCLALLISLPLLSKVLRRFLG